MKPRHSSRRLSSLSPNQALIASAVLAALAMPAAAQGPLQFQELPRMGLPADGVPTAAVALGDVDGDGDLDVMTGNWGQNRLYLNDGTGKFSDATGSQMPVDTTCTNAFALGDVDGDGDLDLVIGHRPCSLNLPVFAQNRLYLNNGAGTFSDATSQMPADNDVTESVALGDVDGDGDLDLVIGNGYYQQNRLYLNNGTGTFSDATSSQLPVDNDYTRSVALGDVDGDGDLDLVCANSAPVSTVTPNTQNRLYLNDGSGTFSDATAGRMPVDALQSHSVALGDVDGDGDLDIAFGNLNAGNVMGSYQLGVSNSLYTNDGAGSFTDVSGLQFPSDAEPTYSLAFGDVDGDGDLDVVCANHLFVSPLGFSLPTPNELYLNDGAGSFAVASGTRLSAGANVSLSVALGDLDGDQDLDVVTGNDSAYGDQLLFNLQRQLHAPAAPQLGQPYTLDAYLRYGPPSTVDLAAVYLSTAPASIALPPFGTVGIDLTMAAPFPTLAIPQPAGVGTVSLTVPNVAGLIGQAIYSQAVLFANPSDLRLSNVVRDVIQ